MIAQGDRKGVLRMVPIAMSLVVVGVVWPQVMHVQGKAGTDWSDFVRGGVFGLAMGMMLMALAKAGWERRS